MFIIPALGRQKQGDHEFESSLNYTVSSRSTWATSHDPDSKYINKAKFKKKRKKLKYRRINCMLSLY
jgi:outer membrane protease